MLEINEKLDLIIKNGFAKDLLLTLQGKNEFSNMRDFDSLDSFSLRLRGMAMKHLEFVSKYGVEAVGETVSDGRHVHTAFPDYFNAWILAGCPGISVQSLDSLYLQIYDSL